jgi:hypothetical protein
MHLETEMYYYEQDVESLLERAIKMKRYNDVDKLARMLSDIIDERAFIGDNIVVFVPNRPKSGRV